MEGLSADPVRGSLAIHARTTLFSDSHNFEGRKVNGYPGAPFAGCM